MTTKDHIVAGAVSAVVAAGVSFAVVRDRPGAPDPRGRASETVVARAHADAADVAPYASRASARRTSHPGGAARNPHLCDHLTVNGHPAHLAPRSCWRRGPSPDGGR